MSAICDVCFRRCNLSEGELGFCKARRCEDGEVRPTTYGQVTSLALDPIEKKPLYHFHPGSMILSVGGYGCNLACPFCQNFSISLSEYSSRDDKISYPSYEVISPEEISATADAYRSHGNIGVAYTYNEPTISREFVIDTAIRVHELGMVNVLVTNGCVTPETARLLLPHIDAMNIDLKSFDKEYYRNVLRGDLTAVMDFIEVAVFSCHVEVTTLVIPGENDSVEEIDAIAEWLASLGAKVGKDIPYHISRFFPRSKYQDRQPTGVNKIYELAEVARKRLKYVHEGNV